MNLLAAIGLGCLQGLTEFLPISSSGHLVLAQEILGVNPPGAALEVSLHLGTLLAVLIYYRRDLRELAAALPGALAAAGRGRWPAEGRERLLLALAVGTVPAILAALFARDLIEAAFESITATLIGLIATGAILLLSRLAPGERSGPDAAPGPGRALLVGAAQALAILPGISRSGSTITAGILIGLPRLEAARFSFLLSVPAILGATLLSIPDLGAVSSGVGAGALVGGVTAAFASGLLALRLILFVARRNRLDLFTWYLWLVAAAGLVLL